jgi:hypothetical protein
MYSTYDIFERLPGGEPMWIKAVESLEEARNQIMLLVNGSHRPPGDFFIFDSRRGSVVRH